MTVAAHPVDLSPWRDGSAADRAGVAAAVDDACQDNGFLLLTGHGIPQATCDALLEAWQGFFDLPWDEKQRWVVADPSANRGYTGPGEEALAYSLGDETPPDLFEAYNVGRVAADGPYFDRWRSFYAPTAWPPWPGDLRDAWLAYEASAADAQDVVLEAMAMALDLPTKWFVARTRNAVVTTRAINYQRWPGSPAPEPGQMRLGAHTDYGIFTLLLADDVPGLQVHRDGSWHDVAIPRGALVGNIGDMLARWTNDRWTSTLHRVTPPPAAADGPVRRRSVARFLDGEPDMVVSCIPTCVTADRPAAYEPVAAGEWLLAKILGGRTMQAVDLG